MAVGKKMLLSFGSIFFHFHSAFKQMTNETEVDEHMDMKIKMSSNMQASSQKIENK